MLKLGPVNTSSKVLLIIVDGFGEGKDYPGNAVSLAKTPTLDKLKKENSWVLLEASGEAVGIPAGTQGGSEVGHFTIGSGRVTWQSLEEIKRDINDGDFFEKPALVEACARVNKNEKAALHLLGMISDQGVHSDIHHLFALLELAKRQKVGKVYIHAITDGRDVPERSATGFIEQIQKKITELKMDGVAKIATIIGRYYAMDRDTNWNRTKKAYDLLVLGNGTRENDPVSAVKNAYERGAKTDYYIDPIILDEHGVIKDKDSVVFFNFRTDRAHQLTWAFTGEEIGFEPARKVRPYFVCIGPYSEKAPVIFPAPIIKNNLANVVSAAGLKQFRTAETEKYAHVTYFFNSQVEDPVPGEERLMIHSPKCPSYAEKPEMSAREITDALLPHLKSEKYALVVLNFANCDLVGHSGNLAAAVKAVEVVDECLGRIIPVALAAGYTILITGDHGNVEYMIYEENGKPCPSHTTNPVPLIMVSPKSARFNKKTGELGGELKDIAPTILDILGIKKPGEMTGSSSLLQD